MSNPKEQETASLKAWSESAPYWDKHASVIRAMFEPLSDALIEDAALGPGKSALDIAAGTGEPSLRIAEVCGPSTSVTCTDPVVEIVAVAKREAGRRSLHNVSFARCAAGALPFRTGRFDAVVCRLGAMFFADPIASLREMLRVLEPRGRLALAVWHGSESNPFFQVSLQVIARYLQLPATAPDAPGAFRYAEPASWPAWWRKPARQRCPSACSASASRLPSDGRTSGRSASRCPKRSGPFCLGSCPSNSAERGPRWRRPSVLTFRTTG